MHCDVDLSLCWLLAEVAKHKGQPMMTEQERLGGGEWAETRAHERPIHSKGHMISDGKFAFQSEIWGFHISYEKLVSQKKSDSHDMQIS